MKPEEKKWSERSQVSFVREFEIGEKVRNLEAAKARTEQEIAGLEDTKKRFLDYDAKGIAYGPATLTQVLHFLKNERRKFAAYEQEIAAFTSEMEKARKLTPGQAAERRERQTYLAGLAAERQKKTELLEGALQGLRTLLKERTELTQRMTRAACALEISTTDLDASRYDELQNSLPESLVEESADWTSWFSGTRANAKTYIIRDEVLMMPETIAHSGVYFLGDKIELNDQEARELLREDRPAPAEAARWRKAPPSVMTVEAHGRAVAEAQKRNESLAEFFVWEDFERDAKLKASYRERPWSVAGIPLKKASMTPLKIKVRILGNVMCGGSQNKVGDVIELNNRREFWQLADSDLIAPIRHSSCVAEI